MKKNVKWMLLGKTGNGKTSLLNYLFNANLPTGAGKPITKYGEFNELKFISPTKQNVTYVVSDSWGLEADKSDKWKRKIYGRLDADFSVKCDNLFVGVIYCLSFNNKVESFEIELIKELITKCNYNVIITLTNADISDYKKKKKEYEEELISDLGIDNKEHYCILDVCSIFDEKLNGEKIIQFGKEEMLQKIEEYGDVNLISIVKSKLGKWKDFWINKCNEYAIKQKPEIGYIKSDLLKTDVKVRRNLSKIGLDFDTDFNEDGQLALMDMQYNLGENKFKFIDLEDKNSVMNSDLSQEIKEKLIYNPSVYHEDKEVQQEVLKGGYWPGFTKALKNRDAVELAKQSHRKDVQDERNDWAYKKLLNGFNK